MSGRRDQNDGHPSNRTEPTLGDLDQVDATRVRGGDGLPTVSVEPRRERARATARKPRKARQRGGRWLMPVILLLAIAFLGAGLWLNQNRLRELVPRTDFNTVLLQARQAMDAGHLDGDDGTSAKELFQAAAALEPDNDSARDGLRQVGQAMLTHAQAALQAGELNLASEQASVARELLGGGSDVDQLDRAIGSARARQVQAVDLVDQARQALAAGKLAGPDGAGVLYQRVLRGDPDNAVAKHGLEQVGYALAVQVRQALGVNDTASAAVLIEQLTSLQPNNNALPALRALQAQTRKQDSRALDAALKAGQSALRAGRIGGTGNTTALAHFQAALKLDPDNADARAGLGKVAQALTVQASAAIDAGDTAQAKKLLAQAAELAPKSADLAATRTRLEEDSATAPHDAPADAPVPAPMTVSPQQGAAVAKLVQRAQLATRRGNIMMPPGDSAYDLYRSALAMDGNSEVARAGLQALPAEVEKLFNQALDQGDLRQAGDMLANLAELAPGDAAQAALNHRLLSAWLDQAEQQLAQGDRHGAGQALQHARKMAPSNPRVLDLDARLQNGG